MAEPATRRWFLASLGLAALALAARGARALPRALPPRVRAVRGRTRTLLLPEEFVRTFRPRAWVRGRGRVL